MIDCIISVPAAMFCSVMMMMKYTFLFAFLSFSYGENHYYLEDVCDQVGPVYRCAFKGPGLYEARTDKPMIKAITFDFLKQSTLNIDRLPEAMRVDVKQGDCDDVHMHSLAQLVVDKKICSVSHFYL